jgi:hypothetical protein
MYLRPLMCLLDPRSHNHGRVVRNETRGHHIGGRRQRDCQVFVASGRGSGLTGLSADNFLADAAPAVFIIPRTERIQIL